MRAGPGALKAALRSAEATGVIARALLRLASTTPVLAAGICLLLAGAPASAEELYRWVDASGRVYFGSSPPPGAREVRIVEPSGEASRINVAPGIDETPAKPASRPAPRRDQAPTLADPRRTLEALEREESRPIGGRTEAEWRAIATRLEGRIDSAEAALDRAEDELSSSYSLARSAYYERRVKAARARLEAAEDELSRFEDNARTLGVPPGWLR